MFYTVLLFAHSWLRWFVLALMLIALIRAIGGRSRNEPWTAAHSKLRVGAVSAFDTQVLLGVLLYIVSPMTPKSGAAMGAYMKVAALRFFTVEHGFAMILAAAALHIGSVRSKKADNDRDRHTRWAIAIGIALVFVLVAIPWPGRPYGRPLFRLP